MNERSYEEYKRNLSRRQKKRDALRSGKVQLIVGLCLLLYTLYLLPFHAGNVSELRGEEIAAGTRFDPQRVYYIENLQLLYAKTSPEDGQVYCVAKFLDHDRTSWIISFSPGRNSRLAEQIRSASSSQDAFALTVSGYCLLQEPEVRSFEADAFYSVYGQHDSDAGGGAMRDLHAEYLCARDGNYTLEVLLRPGIPLASFAAGVAGVLLGGASLLRNRPRRASRRKRLQNVDF